MAICKHQVLMQVLMQAPGVHDRQFKLTLSLIIFYIDFDRGLNSREENFVFVMVSRCSC